MWGERWRRVARAQITPIHARDSVSRASRTLPRSDLRFQSRSLACTTICAASLVFDLAHLFDCIARRAEIEQRSTVGCITFATASRRHSSCARVVWLSMPPGSTATAVGTMRRRQRGPASPSCQQIPRLDAERPCDPIERAQCQIGSTTFNVVPSLTTGQSRRLCRFILRQFLSLSRTPQLFNIKHGGNVHREIDACTIDVNLALDT